MNKGVKLELGGVGYGVSDMSVCCFVLKIEGRRWSLSSERLAVSCYEVTFYIAGVSYIALAISVNWSQGLTIGYCHPTHHLSLSKTRASVVLLSRSVPFESRTARARKVV